MTRLYIDKERDEYLELDNDAEYTSQDLINLIQDDYDYEEQESADIINRWIRSKLLKPVNRIDNLILITTPRLQYTIKRKDKKTGKETVTTYYTSIGTSGIELSRQYEFKDIQSIIGKATHTSVIGVNAIIKFLLDNDLIKRKLVDTEKGARIRYLLNNRKAVRFQLAQYYRLSLVRMYYARKDKKKRSTPDPFAEFRVIIYTQNPEGLSKELIDAMDKLEFIFINIVNSVKEGIIYSETEGEESEPIDIDELDEMDDKAGIENRQKYIDKALRYVAFYNPDNTIKKEYHEAEISMMESGNWIDKRTGQKRKNRNEQYYEWNEKLESEGKLTPEQKERHEKAKKQYQSKLNETK